MYVINNVCTCEKAEDENICRGGIGGAATGEEVYRKEIMKLRVKLKWTRRRKVEMMMMRSAGDENGRKFLL